MAIVLKQIFLSRQGEDSYILKTDDGKTIEVRDINGNGKFDNESTTGVPDTISGLNGDEITLTDEERREVIRIIDEYDLVGAAQSYIRGLRPEELIPRISVSAEEYHQCVKDPRSPIYHKMPNSSHERISLMSRDMYSVFAIDDFNGDKDADSVVFEERGVSVAASRANYESALALEGYTNCWLEQPTLSDRASMILSTFSFVFN
jgi:hypothetical protein